MILQNNRMEKQLKKKKIITGIAVVLLIAVYVMIFSFSSDDADASSAVSVKVTKWLLKIYYKTFSSGNGTAVVIPPATDAAEAVVRKLAHFTEYMAVGLLSFGIAVLWIKSTVKGFLMVVIQLAVSAGLDEIHQYFVPGRYSSVKDVAIDTAGGIAGILIILCAKGIKKRWNHTQERESKTCS